MKTQRPFTEIKVSEIMTAKVQTIMIDDTIQDAVARMQDYEVTAIPVVDTHNKCVGMLSRTDLTDLFLEEDSELSRVLDTDRMSLEWFHRNLETCDTRHVREMMTVEVTTIRQDQNLSDACKTMNRHKIHHLPVVDGADRLVGILSTFDVVKAAAESD